MTLTLTFPLKTRPPYSYLPQVLTPTLHPCPKDLQLLVDSLVQKTERVAIAQPPPDGGSPPAPGLQELQEQIEQLQNDLHNATVYNATRQAVAYP